MNDLRRVSLVYWTAILLSLVLSTWLSIRETVINPDAVCYLLSAQTYGEAGFKAAMQFCPQAQWPFFSIVVALFSKLTHLSLTNAAYCLDAFFSAISVAAFIGIVHLLGGSNRVLWFAAGVILFSHEFNSVKQYIIRDHGFWAFYLLSLFCLIQSFKKVNSRFLFALGFGASLLLASLFRIEGALFLLFVPWAVWFCRHYSLKERFHLFFILNSVTLTIGFFAAVYLCWHVYYAEQALGKLGRVVELVHQLQHGVGIMIERYQTLKLNISQHILTQDSIHEAGLVLSLLLVAWYLVSVLGNLSWGYGAIVLFTWLKVKMPSSFKMAKPAVLAYLIINVIVTFGFLAEQLFFSKRYLIALSLILMLWVPFGLDFICQWFILRQSQSNTAKRSPVIFSGMVGILIIISALGGFIDFGYSKAYLRQAGDWMAKNIPENAALYANDMQLYYYTKHQWHELFKKFPSYSNIDMIAHQQWEHYDWVALRVNYHEEDKITAVLNELHKLPIKIFTNSRGDRVMIYRIERANRGQA